MKIEEIEINIKNPALMIGSLQFARHNVLRVTAKTGEVLAIGSQARDMVGMRASTPRKCSAATASIRSC